MSNSENKQTDDSQRRKAVWKLVAYLVVTMLASSVALILNVGIVYGLYTNLAQFALSEDYAKRLGQLILLLGPFLLLFPEWLLFDLLVTPFRHKR